jgi:glycine/D-amino acid oxidase-like deaminating enzyme
MPALTSNVVICGAGIAGISAAYHLTVRHGVKDVILVDKRPPLTLTSENPRNATATGGPARGTPWSA